MLTCCQCCADLEPDEHIDGFAIYTEDSEYACTKCGAVNIVACGEEGDDYSDVYISEWRCCHGIGGDQHCPDCDAEGRGLLN